MHGSTEKNIEYLNSIGYKVAQQLGRGSYAATFLVTKEGKEYAAKTINPYASEGFDSAYQQLHVALADKIEHIRNEHKILKRAQGTPGLPRAFEIHEKEGPAYTSLCNFITGDGWCRTEQIALIREYIPGKPLMIGEKIEGTYNQTVLSIMVGFLHESGIAHLDFRPANIIIAPNGSPTFIDLGHAKVFHGDSAAFTKAKEQDRQFLEQILGR